MFGYNNGDPSSERAQHGTVHSFDDDPFNRMNGVYRNGALIGDYRYNALNQRSCKIACGEEVAAIYGPGGELLAEIGSGVLGLDMYNMRGPIEQGLRYID